MIEIRNVSKTYPTGIQANHEISFCVNAGEVVALVGPNGSGKTTLFQQILGVIKLGSGAVLVDGKENNTSSIAYVPQFPAIYPSLTVAETLNATAMYLGMPKKIAKEKIDAVLTRAKLLRIAKQPCYTLSGGQRKLLSFACILVQDAPNLVMDEVTSMVDAVTKELIWTLIAEEQQKGKAILLSSHDLWEVKKLSTKVIVLQKGRVIFADSPARISEKFCHCELDVPDAVIAESLAQHADWNATAAKGKISIVTNEVRPVLDMIGTLTDRGELNGFSCEYPAIYEGILRMMKEKTEG